MHIVKDLETFKENTDNYFHKLNNLFHDTPKIVITPIWRGDIETETPIGAFSDIIGVIKESALSIPHTTIVEGLSIVPTKRTALQMVGFIRMLWDSTLWQKGFTMVYV